MRDLAIISNRRKRCTRGFTLIEFMVVMALISIALTMAIVNFGEADASRGDTQAISDLKAIANAVRTQYDAEAGYAGIDEIQVATSTGFPQQLCKAGNCANGIYSAALGDVTAMTAYLYSGVATGFNISFGPLPAERCRAVGARAIMVADSIGVYSPSTTYRGGILRSDALAGAVNPPDLFATACTGNTNVLAMQFDARRY